MSTISPRRRHPTNATNKAPPRTKAINAAAIRAEFLTKRTRLRWTWAVGATGCAPHCRVACWLVSGKWRGWSPRGRSAERPIVSTIASIGRPGACHTERPSVSNDRASDNSRPSTPWQASAVTATTTSSPADPTSPRTLTHWGAETAMGPSNPHAVRQDSTTTPTTNTRNRTIPSRSTQCHHCGAAETWSVDNSVRMWITHQLPPRPDDGPRVRGTAEVGAFLAARRRPDVIVRATSWRPKSV